jgi:opacity protein-like surface antigen
MRFTFVVGLLLLAAVATAQPLAPSVAFGVHGNISLASLPGPDVQGSDALKEVYGTGLGGGVHFDVHFIMIGVRLSADYVHFAPDNDKYQQSLANLIGTAASRFSVDGGGINMFSVSANIKWGLLPIPIVTPYVTGGIGLARLNVDAAKVKLDGIETKGYAGFESETKTAFNLGVGVDIKIGITLFVEARYTWVLTDPKTSTLVPVAIGITF